MTQQWVKIDYAIPQDKRNLPPLNTPVLIFYQNPEYYGMQVCYIDGNIKDDRGNLLFRDRAVVNPTFYLPFYWQYLPDPPRGEYQCN